ncbi:MAG: metalloprotease PmbA [Rhodocyclaceae bacterium]|nr:metalloprotease PmbA [Rhodocyclaceae bacterium]
MPSHGFSFSPAQLSNIAELIVDHARKLGASACETDVSEGFGQSVTVRKGETDTIEYNRDKGVGVTVYVGQKRGHASTSDFSRPALEAAVEAALQIARFTAEDPCAGLAEEALLAREFPDLDLFHPWNPSVEEALQLATRCEQAAFDASPAISNSEGASVSSQQSHFVSANSLGFNAGYSTSRHSISCSVIAGEGDQMQRDDWYDSRRDAADLDAAESIGARAARRAEARMGARRIPTCEVPVLFEAPLATSLLGNFVHAASGGALYRKASFLLDGLGRQLFAPHVQIVERPHLPKAFGSAPFDGDGVATRDRTVVADGVLQGYFLSCYSARKLGMQTTANAGGSHTLQVSHGPRSFEEMLARLDRGLLVTELLGQGVNYVTGDYSRGAAGFWVENGQIQYPVEEITIAGNLTEMFANIVEIGADVWDRGAKHTGSMLIERMKIAGE